MAASRRCGARAAAARSAPFASITPDQRVQARIEISGPGLIRHPEGGIDVMGDGHAIAYTGAIRKDTIEAGNLDQAFEHLRASLGD